MVKSMKALCVSMIVSVLFGCHSNAEHDNFLNKIGPSIVDFGNPNTSKLKQKVKALTQKEAEVLIVTQLGDSHAAADFFTGELRVLMQNRLGNAGVGWITPMSIRGQRHALAQWNPNHWDVISSRTVSDLDFPMGGYIAKPTMPNGYLDIDVNSQENSNGLWNIRIVAKSENPTSKAWQMHYVQSTLPYRIDNRLHYREIGGIWLQKANKSGAIVSSIGTNGAQLSIWNKWSPAWLSELSATNSDLVILEYGTNESFNENLDATEYKELLVNSIRNVRQRLPNAVILLISPPDTLGRDVGNGSCMSQQPPSYKMVKEIQYSVAKSEKLLYWDWQKAMGGKCSMKNWQMKDLAGKDGVHLSIPGYKLSAQLFYTDLMKYLGISAR